MIAFLSGEDESAVVDRRRDLTLMRLVTQAVESFGTFVSSLVLMERLLDCRVDPVRLTPFDRITLV